MRPWRYILACACATPCFGQSMALVQNSGPVLPEPGIDFRVNETHYTFDLMGSTGSSDWVASDVSVTVTGPGFIWHHPAQAIATRPHPSGDPNQTPCYYHNLLPPGVPIAPEIGGNLIFRDTFFTGPGQRFTVAPQFASPGPPIEDPSQCGPPPIVSTPTGLRGISAQGNEIPLAWFDTINSPINNAVLARLTFQVDPVVLLLTPENGPDRVPFAMITGRIASAANPSGNPFSHPLFAVIPEPASGFLLLVGVACLRHHGTGR